MTERFLLATHNAAKLREMREILSGLGVEVVSPSDVGLTLDVEETGNTFMANALIKARAYCDASGLPSIADDSGLCVDCLNGGPGVYSARYGGADLDDAGRCRLLLDSVRGQSSRAAHFTCAVACAFPNGDVVTAEGRCDGIISYAPIGTEGFGYDPIFRYPPLERTFGQLTAEEKRRVSHRGQALASFARRLKEYFGERQEKAKQEEARLIRERQLLELERLEQERQDAIDREAAVAPEAEAAPETETAKSMETESSSETETAKSMETESSSEAETAKSMEVEAAPEPETTEAPEEEPSDPGKLTGKQRAHLRGLANRLETILQVGKDGIGDTLIQQADEALEARELIKGRVLDNNLEYDARTASDELASATRSQVVQVIGSRFVLYRESHTLPKEKRLRLSPGKSKNGGGSEKHGAQGQEQSGKSGGGNSSGGKQKRGKSGKRR